MMRGLQILSMVVMLGADLRSAEPGVFQTELDPLVVSVRHRDEAAAAIPTSVQALDEAFLDAFSFHSLSTAVSYVPGAVLQEQSALFPGFSLRGVTSDEGDAYFEPRVSVFLDGISISETRGALVEPFDLERIEVLKGPQGTYFGRAASAGAVQLIQKKPEFLDFASFEGGWGNYGLREARGVVNLVAVPKTLANRLSFAVTRRDGLVDNLAGGDLMSKDTRAIRDSLRWKLSPDWQIDLVGNYEKNTPSAVAFRQTQFPTSTGSTNIFAAAELNRGQALRNDREISSLSLTVHGVLNDHWELTAISGWRHFDTRRELDADGSQAMAFELTDLADHRQFSQEIRLNFEAGPRLRGVVGASAYWSRRRVEDVFLSNEQEFWPLLRPLLRANLAAQVREALLAGGYPEATAEAQAQALAQLALPSAEDTAMIDGKGQVQPVTHLPMSLANLGSAPPPLSNFAALAGLPLPGALHTESYVNTAEREIYELFADASWKVLPKLEWSAGARLSAEDLTTGYRVDPGSSSSVIGFIPITSDRPAYPNAFFPVDAYREESESLISLVGQTSLAYRWSEQQQLYFLVSHGRRPPVLRIDENGFNRLAEERIWNYELGLKGYFWNRRLYLESSIFHFDYQHFQTLVVDNGRRRSLDAGNAHADGLEVGLRAQIDRDLFAFVNYGYTRFRFDDRSTDGGEQLFAGNQPRLTPDHKLSAGLHWRWKTALGEFSVSPSWVWQSRVYFENDNDPKLTQPAYGLLALQLGFRRGAWTLEAWMQNALDKEYLLDAGNVGNDLGLPTYVPGARRLFGCRTGYQF